MLGLNTGLTVARPAPLVAAGGGGGAFPVNAVHFDGVNDWLSKATVLTGAVDNADFLISSWFKVDEGTDGATHNLFTDPLARLFLLRNGNNNIVLRFVDAADVKLWTWASTLVFSTVVNIGWNHVLLSARTAATPLTHKYINDASHAGTDLDGPLTGTIDWTKIELGIGASFAGGGKMKGDMSEFYMTNEFLDLSVVANRRKFIDASGFPVDLGADGSTPTGTAPLIYQSGDTVSWHTNKGSGGGFTENGALTDAATSPSD